MDRCWDELYRAGEAIEKGVDPSLAVKAIAYQFDLPQSPEAEAVHVFLDALLGNFADEDLRAAEAALAEAAE
jgi:hypothetical protein